MIKTLKISIRNSRSFPQDTREKATDRRRQRRVIRYQDRLAIPVILKEMEEDREAKKAS